MKVSIIIVNWNCIEFTLKCIDSICANAAGLDYEVIVVDNASNDDCGELEAKKRATVKFLKSPSNLGFAGANNLGDEHATGDRILFLNPDTLVLGDAIQQMAMVFDRRPDMGAVGCRQLNSDGTLQVSCVQPFPTISNQVFGLGWLQRRWPSLPLLGIKCLAAGENSGIHDVEGVSGACLMVRRDVLIQAGGFSTDYFMYAEEADLCRRIRNAGWTIGHVSHARIVHFGGEATKQQSSTFSDIVMRESLFKLLRKFRGNTYAWVYRVSLLLSAVLRLALLGALLVFPCGPINPATVRQSIRKWRSIARWSVALERWVGDSGYAQKMPDGSEERI